MHWLSDNYKWLFDGVAGATLVALVGYVVHLFFFRQAATEKTDAILKAEDSQATNSPIAIGSGIVQNIVNVGQQPPAAAHASPPIVGNADLLITRLDLSDLEITPTWDFYEINLGVFIRASIAVTDMPRTIREFELRVDVAGTQYNAKSERELGSYNHVYKRRFKNELGDATERTETEPMDDLATKLRTPLSPQTHQEGWVRFELKKVRQGHDQPKDFRVTLTARDASGHTHPILTHDMRIVAIDSHEYANTR